MRDLPLFSGNYKDVRLALLIALLAGVACGFGYWRLSERPVLPVRVLEGVSSGVSYFHISKNGKCIARLTSSLMAKSSGEKVLRGELRSPLQSEQDMRRIRLILEFDNLDNLYLGTLQIVDKEVALNVSLGRESEDQLFMKIDMTSPKALQTALQMGMITIGSADHERFFLSYSARTEGERIFASSLNPTLLRGLSLSSLPSAETYDQCLTEDYQESALSSYFPTLDLITSIFSKMPGETINGKD